MKQNILATIETERRNENSHHLDQKTTGEILQIINNEDAKIAEAIKLEIPTIESVIDQIHTQLQNGGRLIYVGAGSSGRIGVLDASEMLPTYGVDDQIYGLIAGGDRALRLPIEGAEDSKELCVKDLQAINFKNNDVLFAIGASGRTPYCIGGIEWAKSLGAYTIALCMTKNSKFRNYADDVIEVATGPEVVTGSTRMKSGTTTKMVLNMISTTLMIKAGKVYDNLMVDVKATNQKLAARCVGIVAEISQCSDEELIRTTLVQCNYDCKIAIIVIMKEITIDQAKELLVTHHQNLREVLTH
jgi:N-acetylmuramic acid 6-phosphate etherase